MIVSGKGDGGGEGEKWKECVCENVSFLEREIERDCEYENERGKECESE